VQLLTNTHKFIDEYAKYIGVYWENTVLFRYAMRYLSCVIYIYIYMFVVRIYHESMRTDNMYRVENKNPK